VLLCELCDRSGRSAWPEVASGLTPDSIQKKYAQTVVSAWIALVACSFWWRKNVFTRPGPAADIGQDKIPAVLYHPFCSEARDAADKRKRHESMTVRNVVAAACAASASRSAVLR
jgi:hypothetical protein